MKCPTRRAKCESYFTFSFPEDEDSLLLRTRTSLLQNMGENKLPLTACALGRGHCVPSRGSDCMLNVWVQLWALESTQPDTLPGGKVSKFCLAYSVKGSQPQYRLHQMLNKVWNSSPRKVQELQFRAVSREPNNSSLEKDKKGEKAETYWACDLVLLADCQEGLDSLWAENPQFSARGQEGPDRGIQILHKLIIN